MAIDKRDRLAMYGAGMLGHTVILVISDHRGERMARLHTCDEATAVAGAQEEFEADPTIYVKRGKGWRKRASATTYTTREGK